MRVEVVQAPSDYQLDCLTVFLGGSIEQGTAEEWQKRLVQDIAQHEIKNSNESVLILNPRRDNWNPNLPQDPTPGSEFHEQVTWELQAQEDSDIIVYYFDPKTKSPVTLLEVGLFATMVASNIIVCCPKEFWRYGNVAITCDRYNVSLVHSYDELVTTLKEKLEDRALVNKNVD
jgi:hypothetical protein